MKSTSNQPMSPSLRRSLSIFLGLLLSTFLAFAQEQPLQILGEGQPGDPVIIRLDKEQGLAIPFGPDDLCLAAVSGDRLLGFPVLRVGPDPEQPELTRIIAEMPLVPQEFANNRWDLVIVPGSGSKCPVRPPTPDCIFERIWLWSFGPNDPVIPLVEGFQFPRQAPDPARNRIKRSLHSGPLSKEGELCIIIDGQWDPDCVVCIDGRVHLRSARGWDTRIEDASFRLQGDAQQCARWICDILQNTLSQHPVRPINLECKVRPIPGIPPSQAVELCLCGPEGDPITQGNIDIILKEPVPVRPPVDILQIIGPQQPRPGEVVAILGHNIDPRDPHNHCLGILMEDGRIVPFRAEAAGHFDEPLIPFVDGPIDIGGRIPDRNVLAGRLGEFDPKLAGQEGRLIALAGDGFERVIDPKNIPPQLNPEEVVVWNWQAVIPRNANPGPPIILGRPAPRPPDCKSFFGRLVDGQLKVEIDEDWGIGSEYCINARVHVRGKGGPDTQINGVKFSGVGDRFECAEALCELIKEGFNFIPDPRYGGPLPIDCEVLKGPNGNPVMCLSLADGSQIDQGTLSIICKKPPVIPTPIPCIPWLFKPDADPDRPILRTGDEIIFNPPANAGGIVQDKDDLCIVALNNRLCLGLDPVDVLPNGGIIAEALPIGGNLGKEPFQLKMELGEGQRGVFQPRFRDILPGQGWGWKWNGPQAGGLDLKQDIFPEETPPPPDTRWYFSDDVNQHGRLCIEIDGDWPSNARIDVAARLWNHECGLGYDQFVQEIKLNNTEPLSAYQCARRICDVFRCNWVQQAGFPAICQARPLPGNRAKITIGIPWKTVDWGCITICVNPAKPEVLDIEGNVVRPGQEFKLTGANFPANPDEICLVLCTEDDGAFIPLEVIKVEDDTCLVARIPLGTVPDELFGQPLCICIGRGDGVRVPFEQEVEGVAFQNDLWTWNGRPIDICKFPIQVVVRRPPEPCPCPRLVGTLEDGKFCMVLDQDWKPGWVATIYARIHGCGIAADRALTGVTFTAGGSRFECAEQICEVVRFLHCNHPTNPVAVLCEVTEDDDGNPKITVSLPCGRKIKKGNFSLKFTDCPMAPDNIVIVGTNPGDPIIIRVNPDDVPGLPFNPDDLCIAAVCGDRLLGLRGVRVEPDPQFPGMLRLIGEMPLVPPEFQGKPWDIVVIPGTGSTCPSPGPQDDCVVENIWLWAFGPQAPVFQLAQGLVFPPQDPPPSIKGALHSQPLNANGELCIRIEGEWDPNCVICIDGRVHLRSARGWDTRIEDASFRLGGDAQQCAQWICDILQRTFAQHPVRPINLDCKVRRIPGVDPSEAVELCLCGPEGDPITSGNIDIIIKDPGDVLPPVIIDDLVAPELPRPGDVIALLGHNVDKRDNLNHCMAIMLPDGTLIPIIPEAAGIFDPELIPGVDPPGPPIQPRRALAGRLGDFDPRLAGQEGQLVALAGDGFERDIPPDRVPDGIEPDGVRVWNWQGLIPQEVLPGPPIILGPPQPDEPDCPSFHGRLVDGQLKVLIDKDWGLDSEYCINARVHVLGRGGPDTQINGVQFTGVGGRRDCALAICELIKEGFNFNPDPRYGGPLPIECEVRPAAGGNVEICISVIRGSIDQGTLSIICKKPPRTPVPDICFPERFKPGADPDVNILRAGNEVIIHPPAGGGPLVDDKDDLCIVALNNQVCMGLDPIDLLPDGGVVAEVQPIPQNVKPAGFQLMVERGNGQRNLLVPAFGDIEANVPGWGWRLDPRNEGGGQGVPVLPTPVPPPPDTRWYFSDDIGEDGRLCIIIDGDWPVGARIDVAARLWNHECHLGYDQFVQEIKLRSGERLNAYQCARRICDVFACNWFQQAGFRALCSARPLPGNRAKITIGIPWKKVDWGCLSICVNPPKPEVLDIEGNVQVPGQEFKVFGTNFPANPDEICLVLCTEDDGAFVPLDVVRVESDTCLVARIPLGTVPPDFFGKAFCICIGRGDGVRIPFDGKVDGVAFQNDLWTWNGRPIDLCKFPIQVTLRPPPEPCPCPRLVGTLEDGKFCMVLDQDWKPGWVATIYARIHGCGIAADRALTGVTFTAGGSRFECAEQICEVVRFLHCKHPSNPVTVICEVTEDANGNPKITVSLPCGRKIKRGNFSLKFTDCPMAPDNIVIVAPNPGDPIIIRVNPDDVPGLPFNPDDLCIAAVCGDRLLGLRGVRVEPDPQFPGMLRLIGEMPLVPPEFQGKPWDIVVIPGNGSTCPNPNPQDDCVVENIWLWAFGPQAPVFQLAQGLIFPPQDPPPNIKGALHSQPLTPNGELCIRIEGEWDPNCVICIDGRVHLRSARGWDTRIEDASFRLGGDAQQCAQWICDILQRTFADHPVRPINLDCKVRRIPGVDPSEAVELCLCGPEGDPITSGNIDIIIKDPGDVLPPAVVNDLIAPANPIPGEVIAILGNGVDQRDADNHCIGIMLEDGRIVPMRAEAAAHFDPTIIPGVDPPNGRADQRNVLAGRLGHFAPELAGQKGQLVILAGDGFEREIPPDLVPDGIEPDGIRVWNWQGNIPLEPIPGPAIVLGTPAPQLPDCPSFHGRLVDGQLKVIIDKNWGLDSEYCINARVHVRGQGGPDTQINGVQFTGVGGKRDCALAICELIKEGFNFTPDPRYGGPLPIECEVVPAPDNNVAICISVIGGSIDQGTLSIICKKPPRFPFPEICNPLEFKPDAEPGQNILRAGAELILAPPAGAARLTRDKDDLCIVALNNKICLGLDPIDILPNGAVVAEALPMPPNIPADGFELKIEHGDGQRVGIVPAFNDINLGAAAWGWKWNGPQEGGGQGVAITPRPVAPPPATRWYFSDDLNEDGRLCIEIDGDWPVGARIDVAARLWNFECDLGYDQFVQEIKLDNDERLSAYQCARRICDIFRCNWIQQAGFPAICSARPLPGNRAKITIGIPWKKVDWGCISICVNPPKPEVLDIVDNPQHPGDEFKLVGTGFPQNGDLLCLVLCDDDGNFVPLEVVRVESDTCLVAKVPIGVVPHDLFCKPLQVCIGRGDGRRAEFDPDVPDVAFEGEVWTWDGRPIDLCRFPITVELKPNPTPPTSCPEIIGELVDGKFCMTLDQDWCPGWVATIYARIHGCGIAADRALTGVLFESGGTRLECADRICDVVRYLHCEHPTNPVVVVCEVTRTPGGNPKITISLPCGRKIKQGNFSIQFTKCPPCIDDIDISWVRPGDIVKVTAQGLPTDPDNLCVALEAPNGRLIGAEPVRIIGDCLWFRVPYIPRELHDVELCLNIGRGVHVQLIPNNPNVIWDEAHPAWRWAGLKENSATARKKLRVHYVRPPGGFNPGNPVQDGVLCALLDVDWQEGLTVSVDARVHKQGTGADTNFQNVAFTGAGDRFECALNICDLLVQLFANHPTRPLDIDCRVTDVNGVPKITISCPDGAPIDAGQLDIRVVSRVAPPTTFEEWVREVGVPPELAGFGDIGHQNGQHENGLLFGVVGLFEPHPDPGLLPQFHAVQGNRKGINPDTNLEFTVRRRRNDAEIHVFGEVSADLQNWKSDPMSLEIVEIRVLDEEFEEVTYRDLLGDVPQKYGRARAVLVGE